MTREAHLKLSKDLVGRGHSKPRGANAVCKPTANNSNIKILLTPDKQNNPNDGPVMFQALFIWFCDLQKTANNS